MISRFAARPPQGKPEVQTMRPSLIPFWGQHTVCVLTNCGRKNMSDGLRNRQDSLKYLAIHGYEVLTSDVVPELEVTLAKQSARSEALELIVRSIAAVVKANKPLHLPAFFLAKGSAFASGDVPESLLAEEFFAKAMMQARQESALPFELRAGLELARIWIERGEVPRARDLISPIYSRFSEGFTTPDLILARQILEQTSVRARQTGRRVTKSSGRAKV